MRVAAALACWLGLQSSAAASESAGIDISASMAQKLRALVQKHPERDERQLLKIGDSQTVSPGFLQCFADPPASIGHALFARSSLLRTSRAAKEGQVVHWVLGDPLRAELKENRGRYAVVMFGTNDVQNAPTGGMRSFAYEMAQLGDALVRHGVIPLFTSPPPRPLRPVDQSHFGVAGAGPWVPRYAAIVRGIAKGRQWPFLDLESALNVLPDAGLMRDGVHLRAGANGACDFSEEGMQSGHNVRNWLTMRALEFTAGVVRGSNAGLKSDKLVQANAGTAATPVSVDEWPYTDLGRGASMHGSALCSSGSKERVYELTLKQRAHLRATVFTLGAAPIFMHFRDKQSGQCTPLSRLEWIADAEAGTYQWVVSTPAKGPAGDYLITVLSE